MRLDQLKRLARIVNPQSQCALSASRRCDRYDASLRVRHRSRLNAHLAQAGVATRTILPIARATLITCLNAHLAQAGVATDNEVGQTTKAHVLSQCALSASRRCDEIEMKATLIDGHGLNAHLAQAGVATVAVKHEPSGLMVSVSMRT